MLINGQDILGAIVDMDGTLYDESTPAMYFQFHNAAARAAIDCGVPLGYQEAFDLAAAELKKGVLHLETFRPFGVDPVEYIDKYHKYLDENAIDVPPDLADRFRRAQLGNYVLVTHASRNWAERVIKHLGLEEWFPPERILGFEDYGYQRKSASDAAFVMALDILGVPAENTMVLEDSARNLLIPSQMGMLTVQVVPNINQATKPAHVDMQVASAEECLDMMARAQMDNKAGAPQLVSRPGG
ncbi:MAG: HAD hydrolase-like protein [Alphaproteobacteria bacterium]|nr:HAD hydrolase-like protein [Alphaproteobacteria bacterium]